MFISYLCRRGKLIGWWHPRRGRLIRSRGLGLVLVGCLLAALVAGSARATDPTSTLTFLPTGDSYVRSDSSNTNFGSATSIQVDNSPVKHILLKFTASGIGSQSVTSAKLRLYAVDPSSRGGDVRRALSATWNESTVTWTTAPAADSAIDGSLGRVVANAWYEVGVTPLVTGDGSVSVRITSSSTDGADYASKERGAGLAPQLVVTVTGDAAGAAPQNTAQPTIGGPLIEGELVTANPGTWSGAQPISYSYQWWA